MSDLPFATSDKRQAVKIRLGPGAKQKPRTVTQNFDDIVKKYPNKPALHQKIVPPVSTKIPLHVEALELTSVELGYTLYL